MNKLLLDILTGKSNLHYDNGRVLGALTVLTFIGCTIYTVVSQHNFDYEKFGMGAGLVFSGIGINLKLKEQSEPDKNA